MNTAEEQALIFQGYAADLVGILHPTGDARAPAGVLIVVGGPQYRVGSHRQFVLLARQLAARGVAAMRFDYQGMGDSDGEALSFEAVDGDIRAAIDVFCEHQSLSGVVLWGLCDAASAALFYAASDPRVQGLVLLNPWVRTEAGIARAYVQHYYRARFFQRDTWMRLLSGKLNPWRALHSLREQWLRARRGDASEGGGAEPVPSLPERMADGLAHFQGPVLLILSGDDLTAQEFEDVARQSPHWQALLRAARVTIRRLPAANHTFSRREWRDQVANWSSEWVRGLAAVDGTGP